MSDTRRIHLALVAAFCGAAASAVYRPTLAAQFVWDDHILIARNPDLDRWSTLIRGFASELETLKSAAYYRPVLMASYVVDRKIWGLDPAGFHLTNVILHGLVTALVCVLGFVYFGNLPAAAIGSLLFALHPIQAQSVALILGRNDLLLALPIIALLIIGRRRGCVSAVMLLYAIALCTKETGIVAPVLLLAADTILGGNDGSRFSRWRVLAPSFAAVTACYLLVRFEVLGSLASPGHGASLAWNGRLSNAITFFGYYVRHVVFPWHLSPAPYSPRLAEGSALLESTFFVLLFVGGIAWALLRSAPIGYGLIIFAVALLPVSGLLPVQVPVLEHRLYLPMVGIAVAAASIASRFEPRRSLLVALPLFAVFAIATAGRLPVFHDDLTLWTSAVEAAPDSAYAHHGYALALARVGRDPEAIEVFREALRLDPTFHRARYEMALALERAGCAGEAMATVEDLLRRTPEDVDGWNALAFLWNRSGDLEKSRDALERGLRLDPTNAVLLENLGDALAKIGNPTRAREIFERLVRLHPDNRDYRTKLERFASP